MTKVYLTLALFVMFASGGLLINSSGKAAKSEPLEGAKGTVSAAANAGALEDVTIDLDASFESSQPSVFNPFPALQTPLFAFAGAAQTGTVPEGDADMNPINRSGIRGLINVKRIGQTNTVTGFATGMDPYKAYVSLFYDAGSPGTGPCACIPSNPPPAALASTCKATNSPPVNFSQMVIGYWLPLIGSTTRTLQVLKAGNVNAPVPLAFVPLENIGSVSIREDTQLGQPLPAAPDPARFQLRACGKFRPDK